MLNNRQRLGNADKEETDKKPPKVMCKQGTKKANLVPGGQLIKMDIKRIHRVQVRKLLECTTHRIHVILLLFTINV